MRDGTRGRDNWPSGVGDHLHVHCMPAVVEAVHALRHRLVARGVQHFTLQREAHQGCSYSCGGLTTSLDSREFDDASYKRAEDPL